MFPSSHDPVLIEIRDAHEGEEKAQQQRETKAAHELLVESPPKHAKTQMRRWCLKSNKSNCTTGPLPVSKNSYIYHYIYHNNVKYKYVIKYMLKNWWVRSLAAKYSTAAVDHDAPALLHGHLVDFQSLALWHLWPCEIAWCDLRSEDIWRSSVWRA